jgi:hypothetical protein
LNSGSRIPEGQRYALSDEVESLKNVITVIDAGLRSPALAESLHAFEK